METSLEVLNKIQRVTPPYALYNKIMESISDRADIKLIYASIQNGSTQSSYITRNGKNQL